MNFICIVYLKEPSVASLGRLYELRCNYDSPWILECWYQLEDIMRCIHSRWTEYDVHVPNEVRIPNVLMHLEGQKKGAIKKRESICRFHLEPC